MKHFTKTQITTTAIALAAALTLTSPVFADTNVNVQAGVNANVPGQSGQGRPGVFQHIGQRIEGGIENRMENSVIGKVTVVSGTTLNVDAHTMGNKNATTTFSVDASSAVVYKNNATSTLGAVSVGDTIFVTGTVNGTNVTAKVIRAGIMEKGAQGGPRPNGGPEIQGNGQPVVAGTIASVSGSSFTLTNNSSSTYSVDASNAQFKKGNATSTISSLAVNDRVLVQGTVNGTSIAASLVIDQSASANTGNHAGDGNGGKPLGILSSIGSFFKHLFGF